MLAVKYRLTKDRDFDNVFKRGRAGFDGILGVKAVANKLEFNRFGIIVSAKISKKATERNRIRRRVRTAIGSQIKSMKPGYDIMIICQPGSGESGYSDILASTEKHFRKLGLLIK